MIIEKFIRKIALTSVVALAAVPALGQDLMARQAPVDQRSKAVDPVALQSVINRENSENPSSDLYEEWENRRTHAVYELPDVYKINLQGFHMPTTSRTVTSGFGRRWGRMHKGLDIKVYIGDTIRAAFSGKVRIVRYEARGYGNYVVIRHNNGLETVYGHMSKQLVRENQMVRAGQPIGLGGNTGRSTGSHLHFETRLCGVALNPALLFDFPNQDVTCEAPERRSGCTVCKAERTRCIPSGRLPLAYRGSRRVAREHRTGSRNERRGALPSERDWPLHPDTQGTAPKIQELIAQGNSNNLTPYNLEEHEKS